MSDEIKAAERYLAGDYLDRNGHPEISGNGALTGYVVRDEAWDSDARLLIEAYLAAEAAREAEQAERAKGITEEWLLSIGFTKAQPEGATFFLISSKWHEVEVIGGLVYLAPKDGIFIRIGTALTTTRGMMLDFLSSLKIPTKAVTHVVSD